MNLLEIAGLLKYRQSITDAESDKALEYLETVTNTGADILKDKSKEEIAAALAMIQTVFQLQMMQDGNMGGYLMMEANRDAFDALTAIALRCSLGVATLEEWQ